MLWFVLIYVYVSKVKLVMMVLSEKGCMFFYLFFFWLIYFIVGVFIFRVVEYDGDKELDKSEEV